MDALEAQKRFGENVPWTNKNKNKKQYGGCPGVQIFAK